MHKRKRRLNIWKKVATVLAVAVPVVALLWTIGWTVYERVHPHRELRAMQIRFFYLDGDALARFAQGDMSVLAPAQITNPLFISTPCNELLMRSFNHVTSRTYAAATFLAIGNAGSEEIADIDFASEGLMPTQHNLLPKEFLVQCVRLRPLNSSSAILQYPIKDVVFKTSHGEQELWPLSGIPDESEMTHIPDSPIKVEYPPRTR